MNTNRQSKEKRAIRAALTKEEQKRKAQGQTALKNPLKKSKTQRQSRSKNAANEAENDSLPLDRILSVANRSVNFENFSDESDTTLLELGKAWLENAPASRKKIKYDMPDSEKHLPPPVNAVVKKPESIFKPRLMPDAATTTKKEDLIQTTPAVSQKFLLACTVVYLRRTKKKLKEYQLKRYQRYKERLRALNIAVPE